MRGKFDKERAGCFSRVAKKYHAVETVNSRPANQGSLLCSQELASTDVCTWLKELICACLVMTIEEIKVKVS
jgi:hypothetical protein